MTCDRLIVWRDVVDVLGSGFVLCRRMDGVTMCVWGEGVLWRTGVAGRRVSGLQ